MKVAAAAVSRSFVAWVRVHGHHRPFQWCHSLRSPSPRVSGLRGRGSHRRHDPTQTVDHWDDDSDFDPDPDVLVLVGSGSGSGSGGLPDSDRHF